MTPALFIPAAFFIFVAVIGLPWLICFIAGRRIDREPRTAGQVAVQALFWFARFSESVAKAADAAVHNYHTNQRQPLQKPWCLTQGAE